MQILPLLRGARRTRAGDEPSGVVDAGVRAAGVKRPAGLRQTADRLAMRRERAVPREAHAVGTSSAVLRKTSL